MFNIQKDQATCINMFILSSDWQKQDFFKLQSNYPFLFCSSNNTIKLTVIIITNKTNQYRQKHIVQDCLELIINILCSIERPIRLLISACLSFLWIGRNRLFFPIAEQLSFTFFFLSSNNSIANSTVSFFDPCPYLLDKVSVGFLISSSFVLTSSSCCCISCIFCIRDSAAACWYSCAEAWRLSRPPSQDVSSLSISCSAFCL